MYILLVKIFIDPLTTLWVSYIEWEHCLLNLRIEPQPQLYWSLYPVLPTSGTLSLVPPSRVSRCLPIPLLSHFGQHRCPDLLWQRRSVFYCLAHPQQIGWCSAGPARLSSPSSPAWQLLATTACQVLRDDASWVTLWSRPHRSPSTLFQFVNVVSSTCSHCWRRLSPFHMLHMFSLGSCFELQNIHFVLWFVFHLIRSHPVRGSCSFHSFPFHLLTLRFCSYFLSACWFLLGHSYIAHLLFICELACLLSDIFSVS